ncbi:MAG TPA: RIP metalloprotease RseP [Gammaproteobacteria bacterium]|nr:RIP metalloprotease RseP [Gammaproteobacteria bacterium]
MNILISIVAFVVAICILIIWHEFGHFIVMRYFGIKVLRFSVFFGKPLLRWQRRSDSTELAIGWLPLGGYVKPLDEHDGEVPEAEKHLAFNRQPLAKRFLAVLAGPVFNFIFAILAYWVIFMIGVPGIRPIIGDVRPGSAAAQAGFVKEDEILAVNGNSTPTWDTALVRLFEGVIQGGDVGVQVRTPDHGEKQLLLNITDSRRLTEPGMLLSGLGFSQWQPQAAPEVGEILPDGTAGQAGLRPGDVILKVDGTTLIGPEQLIKILRAAPNRTLKILVKRGVRSFDMQLPVGVQKSADGKFIGHIGAQIGYPEAVLQRLDAEQRYNPVAALGHAFVRTGSLAWLTLDASWNMVIGKVSLRNLSGPIDIAQYAGYTAENGLVPFLAFLAIVSISLGVLNLLPIPVLDGGHLLYYILEAVKGSPLSIQAEILGQRVGIALLLVLMSFAIYNDLMRLFG